MDKRWLRIISVAFVMYTISFVDRTNVSLALPSMIRDLHMSPTQAGGSTGMFFWGYMLLQIPGGYIAGRWSPKWFVSLLLLGWGACAAGTALVETAHGFAVMRFLLGVAEGGVWPATLVLLANWFPRAERGRANAWWMLCLPLAIVLSSPLSGWILGRWNWRVLLVAEGALPLIWLLVWLTICDHPRQARWIPAEERARLETTLRREAEELEPIRPEPYLKALLQPQVLILAVLGCLWLVGVYGLLFWLPSAIESGRQLSHERVGILFAVPYILAAIVMVPVARHSDRRRERRGHVSVALACSGISLAAAVLSSGHSTWLSFGFICLAGAAPWAGQAPFWAIPTETLSPSVAGSAMGFINAVANLGGYFGPLMVGYMRQRTGDFGYAFGILSLSLIGAAGLALCLRSAPRGNESL